MPIATVNASALDLGFLDTMSATRLLNSTPLPADEMATLKTLRGFDTLSDADAFSRLVSVRGTVLDSVDALSLDDPCLGSGLLQLYNDRRISIASGLRVAALLRRGSSGGLGDQAINLYEYPCEPAPVKLFDRDFLRLTLNLGHQGELLNVPGYSGTEPGNALQQALWAYLNQAPELHALTQDLNRISSWVTVLESISNNLTLPADTTGSAWRIGSSILLEPGWTQTQRRQAALDAWALIEGDLKPRTEFALTFRQTYQQGLQYYTAGQLSGGTAYNDWMKKTGWFSYSDYYRTGEFAYVAGYGGAGSFSTNPTVKYNGDPTFHQIGVRSNGTKSTLSWNVGLNYLSDARRWNNKLIIAGDEESTQRGVVRGYMDNDGDGIIDQGTGRELMRYPEFYGGLKFDWNRSTQKLMGFNRNSAQLYEFIGSDADGFPTGKVARGSINLRSDLMDFKISADTKWAFAYPDYKLSIDPYYRTAISHWSTGTLQYATYRIGYDFKELRVNAALARSIEPGNTEIYATTTPGWTCSAYRWDGATKTALDSAQADPNGHMMFYLNSPLQAGDRIIIGSEISGWWSPTYTVPNTAATRLLQPRIVPGKKLQLESYGMNYLPQTFLGGTDLSNLQPSATPTTSSFGKSFLKTDLSDNASYWRVRNETQPQTSAAEYFTIAPGISSEFYPSFNARLRAGTSFDLLSPLNLNTDRFEYLPKGYFKHVGLTTDMSFGMQYHAYSGGQTGAPTSVTITLNYLDLSRPPVEQDTNGVAVALVRCLVLDATNHYPIYQFHGVNGTNDVCKSPHWHSFFGTVYPLESPTAAKTDPDPGSCGYGKIKDVPQATVRVPLSDFDSFKILHFPPL